MKLRTRLALAVVLFMSAFIAIYTLQMLISVPGRANAETRGALPWITDLLPSQADTSVAGGTGAALERLARQIRSMHTLRHAQIFLKTPDGEILAVTPRRPSELPQWVYKWLARPYEVIRKDVHSGGNLIAYFETVSSNADEITELWEEFTRHAQLVIGLGLAALALILWYTFRALQPLDQVRKALTAVGSGERGVRLPASGTPEIDQISESYNLMVDKLAAANVDRRALLRRLIEVEETARRSVAHDLHDDLAPYLIALQPLTRTVQRECRGKPEFARVTPMIDTMIEHQTLILARLRTILTGLHPPELETLGLRRAVERLVRDGADDAAKPLQITFEPGGDWQSFGPTLDVSLYRMIRECLTNARRHGTSPEVRLSFDLDGRLDDGAALTLTMISHWRPKPDATDASAPPPSGLGILGMRDRCTALGGRFSAGPDQQDRWRVEIVLPLDREPAESYPLVRRHEHQDHPGPDRR